MPIYAYADETIFDIDEKAGIHGIGYGIFISKTEIQPSLIDEAIQNLVSDPEVNLKKDTPTINNGYFHASDDSPNAHSHLCRAIKKNVKGLFDFTYFIVSPDEIKKQKQQERFLNRCLSNSSIEFFNSMQEVHLVIEGRSELRKHHIEKWREKIYELLEGASYHNPFYKTFFPKINVQIGQKGHPGLQVADFMSWAISRSFKQSEEPKWQVWLNRIGYHFTAFSKVEGSTDGRAQCHLNEGPDDWPGDYPYKFSKSKTNEDVIYGYILIERFIWHVEESDFSAETMHLFADFQKAANICKGLTHLLPADFSFIARVFIRLFDSLSLYSHIEDSDAASWERLFHAKEVATLLIMKGYIHTGRTQNHIQRWRYEILVNDKERFLELMQSI